MKTIYVVRTDEMGKADTIEDTFATIEDRGFFAERTRMETRPDFQQIIPSFVIRDKEKQSILVYQRKSKHTEQRLAGLFTMIFGGHIDPEDWDKEYASDWVQTKNSKVPPVVFNGLIREMEEETGVIVDAKDIEFFTLIEDKSNEVGKVHTGILFLLDLNITPKLKEQILSKTEIADILEVNRKDFGSFLNSEEVELESWAKLVLKDFIECPEC